MRLAQPSNEAPSAASPDPNITSKGMGEAEYLAHQAAMAREAITGAFAELKTDLGRGVDPRMWMKSHPWMTLASAAVAGFAAASAAVPSKQQQALRKLASIERAVHASHHDGEPNGNGAKPAKHDGGFLGLLLHELISAVKPTLIAVLTSRMAPLAAPSPAMPADASQATPADPATR